MLIRNRSATFLSFALSLVCAGCDLLDSGPRFSYAAATNDCGPADGPAVSIYLAAVPLQALQPPTPYVRLIVWQPVGRLAGRSWSLGAGEAAAVRAESNDATDWATSGNVIVEAVDADNTVRGSAELWFPDATKLTVTYAAVWIPSTTFCG